MILPIRTSIVPHRKPYVNYALIAVNFLLFFISYHPHVRMNVYPPVRVGLMEWTQQFLLNPNNLSIWQFVSYAFLHANWAHILGNMFFLYIFGNNINDRLGHIGYLCFYLAGGIAAGIGHVIFSASPVLGASGAVAAVTGAYLALYPKSVITVLYWFFFIGTLEVPALLFIAIKLIFIDNVLNKFTPASAVAYDAHLSGYAFGIISMLLLRQLNFIRSEGFDLLVLCKQWYRRKVYRGAVSNSYDPFTGIHNHKADINSTKKSPRQLKLEEDIMALRQEIIDLINRPDLSTAADKYLQLLQIDSAQVMPKQYQLDISNQLMAMSNWEASAMAYEKFLKHYPSYEHIEQIKLMLGILYSRYLKRPKKARLYLSEALDGLTAPDQIELCRTELKKTENSF